MKRAALLLALAVPGCAGLQAPPAQPVSTYLLEASRSAEPQRPERSPSLVVGVPRARAGFDSPQMAYTAKAHELAYFAAHRWADAPARMLAPLIAEAMDAPGCRGRAAAMRLDAELVRLVQDFTVRPSRVRLTLRLELVDVASRRVLAARELDEIEPAPSDDPYGGVVAANRALGRLLGRLDGLCAAARLDPGQTTTPP